MGFGINIAQVEEVVEDAHSVTDAAVAAVASSVTVVGSAVAAVSSAVSVVSGKVDTVDGNVDAIKLKTDNLPTSPADETLLEAILGRKGIFVPFWCHPSADKVSIDDTAANVTFPDIVVSGLPSGLTLLQVRFALAIANLKDTSGSDNYINGASKSIRLKISTGTWLANSVIGLTFDNQALYTTGGGERGGPVLLGPDIKTSISANGTYNVRSDHDNHADAIVALAADLEMYDVDVGLMFIYT